MLSQFAKEKDCFIVAGSFHDEKKESNIAPIFSPQGKLVTQSKFFRAPGEGILEKPIEYLNVIDFLDEHTLLKVWVVFDVLCIFLFIAYGLSHGIEFNESPGLWLLLGFGPLFLPLFAVAEYQRFKRLGEQSNPRFQGTAAQTRRRP